MRQAYRQRLCVIAAGLLVAGCAYAPGQTSTQSAQASPSVSATIAPSAASPAPPPPASPAAPTAPAAQGASGRTDYALGANWLCRPGIPDNACEVNLDTTIVSADGSTIIERHVSNPNPPIDCFYVYPTVSLDPFTQSDLIPGPEELNVVKAQVARLGRECRIFAPMYRQFSLGALRARMSGSGSVPVRGSPADANADVDDAWDWYMANENKGRGVVILGHSQGSGQIMRLIASKIDGKPAQQKLVSAIVMGFSMLVPKGQDVGGTFQSIPVCRSPGQTGCAISFSSFRSDIPPAPAAMFGLGRGEMEAVCTNPAGLSGGAAQAKAYWSTSDKTWVKGQQITTPFVATPGLTTTECVREGAHHYLKVTFSANPDDPRIDDPGTDVMANGKPDPAWGLHLNDANIAMGDLLDVVAGQSAAWKRRHP